MCLCVCVRIQIKKGIARRRLALTMIAWFHLTGGGSLAFLMMSLPPPLAVVVQGMRACLVRPLWLHTHLAMCSDVFCSGSPINVCCFYVCSFGRWRFGLRPFGCPSILHKRCTSKPPYICKAARPLTKLPDHVSCFFRVVFALCHSFPKNDWVVVSWWSCWLVCVCAFAHLFHALTAP